MIKRVKGNLVKLALEGNYDIIIHGCNCFCKMNRGLALEIAKAFPEAKNADDRTLVGDVYKLGDYSRANIKRLRLTVVNLYTQYEEGENFEYTALGIGLRTLVSGLQGDEVIAMPLIGAGINRGKSNEIYKIIAKEFDTFDLTLIEHTL